MSYLLRRPDGTAIPLRSGRSEVGRSAPCDLRLDDPAIADRHAVLFNVYGRLWIQGTAGASVLVNGELQQSATLKAGDELQFGETRLRVDVAQRDDELKPPTTEFEIAHPVIHTSDQQLRGTGLLRKVASGTLSAAQLARYVMAFHRLSQLIHSMHSREAIIQEVLELLRELFAAGTVHFVERRRGQGVRIIGGRQGSAELPTASPDAPSQTLLRRVLEEQVSYLVVDPGSASPATPGRSSDSMMAQGIRAAMAAPVPIGEDIAAALYVDTRDLWGNLERDDLALLEATATYVAMALEKADLYADLDRRVRSATQEVRRRAAELERRNAELSRVQAQREMLVSLLVHDIKGGLSAIRAGVELAGECGKSGRADILAESLDAARQGANRLEAMVGDMLDVSRLEDGALVPRRASIPLAALFDMVAGRWVAAAASRRVTLRVHAPSDASLSADGALLSRVLDNLVSNALRFAPPNTPVELSARRLGEDWEVTVADKGPGIEEAQRQQLFQKYGRLQGKTSGHGLGLYFCRLAIEAHGGSIEASGARGDNRVVFRLPPR